MWPLASKQGCALCIVWRGMIRKVYKERWNSHKWLSDWVAQEIIRKLFQDIVSCKETVELTYKRKWKGDATPQHDALPRWSHFEMRQWSRSSKLRKIARWPQLLSGKVQEERILIFPSRTSQMCTYTAYGYPDFGPRSIPNHKAVWLNAPGTPIDHCGRPTGEPGRFLFLDLGD